MSPCVCTHAKDLHRQKTVKRPGVVVTVPAGCFARECSCEKFEEIAADGATMRAELLKEIHNLRREMNAKLSRLQEKALKI